VQVINGVRSEIAGVIDHQQQLVTISENFRSSTKRFTTAHELAHAVLHADGSTMHRDLPLERAGVVRDWREVEANRFGSAYVMPSKSVEKEFGYRFGPNKFELTDATAFALCGTNVDTVNKLWRSPRQLSLTIAGAERFDGAYFQTSLSERFKVSPLAMAIRLEDIGLV
jgi:Zn-dependent peptidase ImmA (M78 family)